MWLICWSGAQETGLHDHDLSGGAVRVIDGALAEDRLCLGSGVETARTTPGSRSGSTRRASTTCDTSAGRTTMSLHLYSPPLWRMGYYDVGDDGRISRRSASYAEELRP